MSVSVPVNPEGAAQLRKPATAEEWQRYHDIRKRSLFDGHLHGVVYDPEHPDDRRAGYHPLVLIAGGRVAGTIRIDELDERRVCFRLIAINEALRGQGLGAVLIRLAERYTVSELNRDQVVLYARCSAIPFYRKQGYAPAEPWGETPLDPASEPFGKSLAAAGEN